MPARAKILSFFFFKILFIYFQGGKGERERQTDRQTDINVWLLGVMARNPGMYPGWELNLGHFGSQSELNPLSYASQGSKLFLNKCSVYIKNINPLSTIHIQTILPHLFCFWDGYTRTHWGG
ncbi:hypothetical protein HJG60_009707 [Phyllostomus discolor]|uniref:Uncharacterized protein n=1 Tax=Phyllostomus discolor TaxID=89673 RepID=A0A834ESX2_9CHIR|nr:hypothetical protein HJG60_009707 [Phyllostomus discolor]